MCVIVARSRGNNTLRWRIKFLFVLILVFFPESHSRTGRLRIITGTLRPHHGRGTLDVVSCHFRFSLVVLLGFIGFFFFSRTSQVLYTTIVRIHSRIYRVPSVFRTPEYASGRKTYDFFRVFADDVFSTSYCSSDDWRKKKTGQFDSRPSRAACT